MNIYFTIDILCVDISNALKSQHLFNYLNLKLYYFKYWKVWTIKSACLNIYYYAFIKSISLLLLTLHEHFSFRTVRLKMLSLKVHRSDIACRL